MRRSRQFAVTALGVLAVLGGTACRRHSLGSRGDAAAVVVVAPRHEAKGAPKILEQEPNDIPEQAQLLAINSEWPVLGIEGALVGPGGSIGKDVDVFRLLVPEGHAGVAALPPYHDGGQPADPRFMARRLSIEIASAGSVGLALQFLDDGFHVLESVSVDAGEVAGMPNLAVQPGVTYFFRVRFLAKPAAKPGKAPEPQADECKYKLTLQLGDFEIADEREPNDGMGTANPVVTVGTSELAGLYGWSRDQDYFRIAAPEVGLALEVGLDAVEGVSAGLQVLDAKGSRLAAGKGRKGERLALYNVGIPQVSPEAPFFFVVVRAESGHNRDQRYVLHLGLGAPKLDVEVEPNDDVSHATEAQDRVVTGYLPVGDVDYFRYAGEGEQQVDISVDWPSRVRGKIEVMRAEDSQVIASAEAKKAHQTLSLTKIPTQGKALLLRLTQPKGDGNANDAYHLRISRLPAGNL